MEVYIHLNSWHPRHKKQKDALETQVVFLIFSLELEILQVPIQRIHQTAKNVTFCKELISENDFDSLRLF